MASKRSSKRRSSRNPERQGPEWSRRFALPFAERIEGEPNISPFVEMDRCVVIAPDGDVTIGAARLEQCVIIGPCVIEDGVRATAAILQGRIEENVVVEAHADIMGTVQHDSTIRRGVVVELHAFVGPDCEIGDMTTIGSSAEVGEGVTIGAQSHIGEHAFIRDGARLPARSVVRPHGHVVESAAERQGEARTPEPGAVLRIVDVLNDEDEEIEESEEGEDDEEDEEDEEEASREPDPARYGWTPSPIAKGRSARPGEMAKGSPILTLSDFRPGTARSWVLSKLGRIANLKSPDGRLTKKLVQQYRPDLLDHAVTKEMLRVTPTITDEVLARLSFEALSPARYDVYENITFHSGEQRDWQMVGPQSNDVFVFAVPKAVLKEMIPPRMKIDWRLTQEGDPREGLDTIYTAFTDDPLVDHHPNEAHEDGVRLGTVWTVGNGEWSAQTSTGEIRHDYQSMYDARRYVENEEMEWRDERIKEWKEGIFRSEHQWHPDKHVDRSIGWVRLLTIPPRYVMVVEIQSDRPWMSFRYAPARDSGRDWIEGQLREMYFPTFASDALNIVVEWAFSKRYTEVIVPDFESRARLGGSPPRSFYDDVPKKYTVSAPRSLDEFPVDTYPWVDPKKMKVRVIVPNRGRREED